MEVSAHLVGEGRREEWREEGVEGRSCRDLQCARK